MKLTYLGTNSSINLLSMSHHDKVKTVLKDFTKKKENENTQKQECQSGEEYKSIPAALKVPQSTAASIIDEVWGSNLGKNPGHTSGFHYSLLFLESPKHTRICRLVQDRQNVHTRKLTAKTSWMRVCKEDHLQKHLGPLLQRRKGSDTDFKGSIFYFLIHLHLMRAESPPEWRGHICSVCFDETV